MKYVADNYDKAATVVGWQEQTAPNSGFHSDHTATSTTHDVDLMGPYDERPYDVVPNGNHANGSSLSKTQQLAVTTKSTACDVYTDVIKPSKTPVVAAAGKDGSSLQQQQKAKKEKEKKKDKKNKKNAIPTVGYEDAGAFGDSIQSLYPPDHVAMHQAGGGGGGGGSGVGGIYMDACAVGDQPVVVTGPGSANDLTLIDSAVYGTGCNAVEQPTPNTGSTMSLTLVDNKLYASGNIDC